MTAKIPTWIMIVCSLMTLLSVFVSYSLFTDPGSFIETADFSNGETRLIAQMWGVRQFAIAFIMGFSLWKRDFRITLSPGTVLWRICPVKQDIPLSDK